MSQYADLRIKTHFLLSSKLKTVVLLNIFVETMLDVFMNRTFENSIYLKCKSFSNVINVFTFSSYVYIQISKFNLYVKLEYRIKHLRIKHRFHSTSQREQNRHFLIKWHKVSLRKVGKATENNNFHIAYYKWLAPQSKQIKHNKCDHCFRRRMPAVRKWSCVKQLYRNSLLWWLQKDQNNVSDAVQWDRSAG